MKLRVLVPVVCAALALALVVGDGVAHARTRASLPPRAVPANATAALATSEETLDELPAAGVALLVPPAQRSPRELDALASFAARGGVVLVQGDSDVALRFGVRILDPIVIDDGAPVGHPLVDGRVDARVLLSSSNASFVDVDRDGLATANDAPGPFALVLQTPDGHVIVSGGPDITLFLPARDRLVAERAPGATDALALAFADVRSVPTLGASVGILVAVAGLAPWLGRRAS